MIRRAISAILVLMLILMASAYAEEDNYIGNMKVVNCEEWVSLRKAPDTGSARLMKVPLGAVVNNCMRENSKFIYGEYNGQGGFILAEYLAMESENGGGYIGSMRVVNCNEWVSLRKSPSTGAARLVKVPLGAMVHNCYWETAQFVYAEYNGQSGYILGEYLEAIADPVPEESQEEPAEEGSSNGLFHYPDKMVVYGCDKWVYLWEENDTQSKRLNTVPLGAVVNIIPNGYKSGFYEVEYNGTRGYILAGYLTDYEEGQTYAKADYRDILGNGREMANLWVDGCHIIISHSYEDGESLSIVCLDEKDQVIWNYYRETYELYQLDALSAFCNDETGVLVHAAHEGVSLLDIHTGSAKWFIPTEALSFGGMTGYTSNGMSYVGGYFGPDPVAINEDGDILWSAPAEQDFYWLYKLERASDGLLAWYEASGAGDNGGRICYDLENGEELWRARD